MLNRINSVGKFIQSSLAVIGERNFLDRKDFDEELFE